MRRAATAAVLPLAIAALLSGCEQEAAPAVAGYEIAGSGTRQFEWDTPTGAGSIRMLVEAANLGSEGAEVAEIFFPPDFHGTTHPHELEILVVLDGTLDHIVNGESHLLHAGMVGIVREPDLVVHRAVSPQGVRVLAVWPRGGEAAGFEASGMRVRPVPRTADANEQEEGS